MNTESWGPLEEQLRQRGGRRLLRLSRRNVSGTAALTQIDRAGEALRRLGLEPGEAVGVVAAPGPHTVLALLTLWRNGLVALPLSPGEPGQVLAELLRLAGCRLLLSPTAAPTDRAGRSPARLAPRELLAGKTSDLRLDGAARTLPGDAATLLRTSGTSGRPKLVIHGLRQHLASAAGAREYLRIGPDDSWLLTLPMHHVSGLAPLFRTLVSGAALAIPDVGQELPRALAHFQPTHVSLVSTQLVRLLGDDSANRPLAGCKALLAGGGPFPVPLRRWALSKGLPLIISYGSTETASLLAAEREPLRLLEAYCAGQVLPGRQVQVDPQGAIRVGGDTLMTGYLTANGVEAPFDPDGMFATGDLGHLDQSGRLFVEGRRDQMFISGGENVHPEEIEQALLKNEAIREAVVVPIPHQTFGERPVAFLRCHAGAAGIDVGRLRAQLALELPSYKIPDHFWRLPGPATSNANGLDRQRLQRLAADPRRASELEPL